MHLVFVEDSVSANRLLHIVGPQIVIVRTSKYKSFEYVENELHELPLAFN